MNLNTGIWHIRMPVDYITVYATGSHWIQVQRTKYVEGSVVVVNSSEVTNVYILDKPYFSL